MSDTANKVIDERNFGHARIPNELTRYYARKITKNGIAVYCALAARSDENRSCFPSLDTIAEESDTCKQTVVTYLKLLQKMRMIHIIHHKMENSKEPDVNSYIFRDKSEWHSPDVDLSLLDEYGEIKGQEVVQGVDYHASKQLRSLRRRQQVVQEIDNRSLRRRQQVVQGVDSKNTHSEEPSKEETTDEETSSLSDANASQKDIPAFPIESEWELPQQVLATPLEENTITPPQPLRTSAAKQPTDAPEKVKVLLAEESPAVKLALLLRKKIFDRKPDTKGLPLDQWDDKKLQAWAHTMDLMLRLDGRDHIKAAQLILAVQNDAFWRPIIKNPEKLRQHFDTLEVKLLDKTTPMMSTNSHNVQNMNGGGNYGNAQRRTIRQAPDGPDAYSKDPHQRIPSYD